ncbi:hypothetical protein H8F22_20305 [Pseudomonas sp. P154a]|jgi:hypothetical protein|uniref:hypothetical protein n=1 Tax=Pseudomonas mucoides TaxID=2730424 RepID=UPI001891F61B|nr:hypothetical protein [Pseudomonas mucoides]MBF6041228.1 hypothetical protein [Pseudomonas mucoides]
MKYKQLYEFINTDGAGKPEVVMSRYDEGNYSLDNPNTRITIYSSNDDWKYDITSATNDADGDGDHDEDDQSYYMIAARLVAEMATLSPMDESNRLFDRVLIAFSDHSEQDVNIMHYKKGNRDLKNPDFIVKASNRDSYGRYRTVIDTIDADGDKDIDKDDELIYRNLATSFSSMENLLP